MLAVAAATLAVGASIMSLASAFRLAPTLGLDHVDLYAGGALALLCSHLVAAPAYVLAAVAFLSATCRWRLLAAAAALLVVSLLGTTVASGLDVAAEAGMNLPGSGELTGEVLNGVSQLSLMAAAALAALGFSDAAAGRRGRDRRLVASGALFAVGLALGVGACVAFRSFYSAYPGAGQLTAAYLILAGSALAIAIGGATGGVAFAASGSRPRPAFAVRLGRERLLAAAFGLVAVGFLISAVGDGLILDGLSMFVRQALAYRLEHWLYIAGDVAYCAATACVALGFFWARRLRPASAPA
jgi:hypothetical protein